MTHASPSAGAPQGSVGQPDSDYVARFIFDDLDIRGAVVRLGPVWQALQAGRSYSAPVARLLGEITLATTLVGSQLKQLGRLTLQMRGDGPVSLLIVDCDDQLRLKGMARAEDNVPAGPVPAQLGDGQILLTLELESARQPYQSYVPLEGDTMGAVFEHFIAQSDQQPTRLWLAVSEASCALLFLQRMPSEGGVARESVDEDGWDRVTHLASTVRDDELLGLAPDVLLGRLFAEETVRLYPSRGVTYYCPYNRGKVADMLLGLGRDEVESVLESQGVVEIHDDICNHTYRFTAEDVADLFDTSGQARH